MVNTNFDTCVSFHINNGAFLGRMVRLDKVINTIIERHSYPNDVSGVVAESTALAALLSCTLKYDGLFTLQTKSDGPVNMVVVDITSQGTIRAAATYDEDRINTAKKLRKTEDIHEEAPHFLGNGFLAFTVDQGNPDNLYQGIVEIQGKTLADCAMLYFKQSEQIDTYLKLYLKIPQHPSEKWEAAGILLQKLPEKGGNIDSETNIEESWNEAIVFLNSLTSDEVFNHELSSEELLNRLYHQHNLSVSPHKDYAFGCRCCREKLAAVLGSLKPDELDSLVEKGKIIAECNFCSEKYSFDKGELLKQ